VSKELGAAGQGSHLHIERKRSLPVQQQITGTLCNFIPAVK